MNPIDQFLPLLQKLRNTGANRWLACCPAHPDKTPSLSIRVRDTGKIDIHCFAGCEGAAIMHAIGLRLVDLYPDRIYPPKGCGKKPRFNPFDVLAAMSDESLLMAHFASELQKHPLSEADRKRLFLAQNRFQAANELARGAHG